MTSFADEAEAQAYAAHHGLKPIVVVRLDDGGDLSVCKFDTEAELSEWQATYEGGYKQIIIRGKDLATEDRT